MRENQKDQDSLPPYDVPDAILEGLVEKEMRVADVAALGHDLETVKKIERLLYLAEYKRRQSAPGVKVTRKNFGRDRRYPIVNLFRDPGVVVAPDPAPPGRRNETRRPAVPMPGSRRYPCSTLGSSSRMVISLPCQTKSSMNQASK